MPNIFSFQLVSGDDVSRVIIDPKNNIPPPPPPPSLLKVNVDVIKSFLRGDINVNIVKGNSPVNLKNPDITPIFKKCRYYAHFQKMQILRPFSKNADITPIFKRIERVFETNYRAVIILPTLSKIYENIFYEKIYEYFTALFIYAFSERVIALNIVCFLC